jgi:hypothetical protein
MSVSTPILTGVWTSPALLGVPTLTASVIPSAVKTKPNLFTMTFLVAARLFRDSPLIASAI